MIEHFLNAVGASQPPERYGESFGAAKGNTAGGLLADSRSLVKGEGLRIATWARPPRLTRGATGVSLWASPRSWQNSLPEAIALRLFGGRMGFAQCQPAHYAGKQHSWLCAE